MSAMMRNCLQIFKQCSVIFLYVEVQLLHKSYNRRVWCTMFKYAICVWYHSWFHLGWAYRKRHCTKFEPNTNDIQEQYSHEMKTCFVMCCFLWLCWLCVHAYGLFTYIRQGCLGATGTILWLAQSQKNNPEGYVYGSVVKLVISTRMFRKRNVLCDTFVIWNKY